MLSYTLNLVLCIFSDILHLGVLKISIRANELYSVTYIFFVADIECDIAASAYGFDDANFNGNRTVTLSMANTQAYANYRGLTLLMINWPDFSIGVGKLSFQKLFVVFKSL